MKVKVDPGTWREQSKDLAEVMTPDSYHYDFLEPQQVSDYLNEMGAAHGRLVALLVEKGAITLADCRALGGPHMEQES